MHKYSLIWNQVLGAVFAGQLREEAECTLSMNGSRVWCCRGEHGAVHLLCRQRGSEKHVRGMGRVQRSEAIHFRIVFPSCPCICRFVFEGSLPSPSEHRPPGSKTESWHRIKPAVFFVPCLQELSHCLPYLQVNIFALTAFDCWVSAALQQLSANYPAGCTCGEAPAVRVDPGFAVPAFVCVCEIASWRHWKAGWGRVCPFLSKSLLSLLECFMPRHTSELIPHWNCYTMSTVCVFCE